MAKIFYSLAGEGRGHASRVRALVDHLAKEHQVVLFTYADALAFLAPLYAGHASVCVQEIPGLRFHYTRCRLNLIKTLIQGLKYRWHLEDLVESLHDRIRHEHPDLVITDFEPAMPRAARRAGVPVLSVDHQHFLVACDLSGLPWKLRMVAEMMGLVVRAYGIDPAKTAISSFCHAPLKAGYRHVVQVGPLLRPEIEAARPSEGDFLLAYLRPTTPRRVLEALKTANREVRIYGPGPRADEGPLRFREIHERQFVADLAACNAVVCAAGNQLLGEAIYFGKPVMAIPERRHHEQLINAHYLRAMRRGDWTTLEAFDSADLRRFLARLHQYRHPPGDAGLNGVPAVLRLIRSTMCCPAEHSAALPAVA